MKKGPAIGIGVGVLVFSIMLGIASLPDEVLYESSIDSTNPPTTANVPQNTAVTETPQIEIPVATAPTSPEPVPTTIPEPEVATASAPEPEVVESPEGNIIRVEIRDGVGSADK